MFKIILQNQIYHSTHLVRELHCGAFIGFFPFYLQDKCYDRCRAAHGPHVYAVNEPINNTNMHLSHGTCISVEHNIYCMPIYAPSISSKRYYVQCRFNRK